MVLVKFRDFILLRTSTASCFLRLPLLLKLFLRCIRTSCPQRCGTQTWLALEHSSEAPGARTEPRSLPGGGATRPGAERQPEPGSSVGLPRRRRRTGRGVRPALCRGEDPPVPAPAASAVLVPRETCSWSRAVRTLCARPKTFRIYLHSRPPPPK